MWDVELTLVIRQFQIVRPKVMPPLRDAVRFIHHQQGNRHLLQKVAKAFVFEPFNRNHQNLQFTRFSAGHDGIGLIAALRRINTGRGNPMALQKCQLVLH